MEPTTVQTAEALRVAIGEFVRAARSHERLSGSQMAVLGLLDRSGPATIAALAEVAQIRHQSATKLVAQLESEGAVHIAAHPADRRALQVHLTELGRARITAERERRAEVIGAAMDSSLSAAERHHLAASAELLGRLAAAVAGGGGAVPPTSRARRSAADG